MSTVTAVEDGTQLGAYVGARRTGLAPLIVFNCLAPGLIAAQPTRAVTAATAPV